MMLIDNSVKCLTWVITLKKFTNPPLAVLNASRIPDTNLIFYTAGELFSRSSSIIFRQSAVTPFQPSFFKNAN